MFGNLAHLIPQANAGPRKEVPPPTPVNFPGCRPQVRHDPGAHPHPAIAELQKVLRPADVSVAQFEALGVHVISDAAIADLIPDPAFIPDFKVWDGFSADEAYEANESTQRQLSNGRMSPGCRIYIDRHRELSIENEAAYRAVRRIPQPQGRMQARLGNSFEFYRNLEAFSSFWDDPSLPTAAPSEDGGGDSKGTGDGDAGSTEDQKGKKDDKADPGAHITFRRTNAGHQMPPEFRQNILTAFLKLVAYDFGCNVSAARTEPRLVLTPPPSSHTKAGGSSSSLPASYFSSGCSFLFRTPTTREAAKSGVVEGPLATISARHTSNFPPPRPGSALSSSNDKDSCLDLARELVAALITAQHRAREGKTEKRIGEGQWWTTKPRWGGGPGGPIGREVDYQSGADETLGDKDTPPPPSSSSSAPSGLSRLTGSSSQPPPSPSSSSPLSPGAMSSFTSRPALMNRLARYSRMTDRSGADDDGGDADKDGDADKSKGGAKRLKKSGNLPMYDNYRMIRPPAATWDRKAKYCSIGRQHGADYDDIFVISALFHHISILRVRVPDRLLDVLDGAPDDGRLSWGRLEVRRSKWYDLFVAADRVEAMQLVWCMVAYLMRKDNGDVSMVDV